MYYKQIADYCFADKIGNNGIAKKDFDLALVKASKAIQELNKSNLAMFSLPSSTDGLEEINSLAAKIRKSFKNVVIIGTGGSSLCGRTLTELQQSCGIKKNPRLFFLDNVDPYTTETLLKNLNLEKTFFIVISKSGNTLETISQFLVCYAVAEKQLGKKSARKHFLAITEDNKNSLRQLAEKFDVKILDHDKKVGGRFSTFTNVGLLPAAICGLDIAKIRKGAASVIANDFSKDSKASSSAIGAALNVCLMAKGISCNIMMPYVDRLKGLAEWYCQVWAESLGKDGFGTTPIRAIGTIDQHSQLQLYLDGPADKFFTLILLKQKGIGHKINNSFITDKSLNYIKSKTMGDIMEAEQQATLQTFIRHKFPVRTIYLDKLDEATLGALVMHFCIETIVTGKILGINPFDQPAVEEGKILARKILEKA